MLSMCRNYRKVGALPMHLPGAAQNLLHHSCTTPLLQSWSLHECLCGWGGCFGLFAGVLQISQPWMWRQKHLLLGSQKTGQEELHGSSDLIVCNLKQPDDVIPFINIRTWPALFLYGCCCRHPQFWWIETLFEKKKFHSPGFNCGQMISIYSCGSTSLDRSSHSQLPRHLLV